MAKAGTVHRVVRHLPLTKARINLGAVVKRARLGKEYFILEKDGIPVAAIMDVDEFEDYLELADPIARADIARSRKESLAGKTRSAEEIQRELEVIAPRRRTKKAKRHPR
jgi:prevent-host-death family protein